MVLKEHQLKIIDLFIEQELLVAKIYKLFSGMFPNDHLFWDEISADEVLHAGWLEQLRESTIKGTVRFHEADTRLYTINNFIGYLKKTYSKAKIGKITRDKALSISLDMEKSLLEKNVFDSFSGDSAEVKRTMSMLSGATAEHRHRVEEYASGSLSKY